ncbi:hypothetical protein [Brachybacterium phenoliresistens]|uniref:Uncharacterized protein n=1 Tax=Brachybacterium phenoliresistens TaxID=396014 RepID=Z9JT93_9MICO|nr:hypothetical protein [Brachybacterium phenoliresistens]EWS81258.1 hypothetical protein BF93_17685 [Brachybacterium phenoliresistens]
MPASTVPTPPPLLPRRSLLAAGMLLGPLALTACEEGAEEEPPPSAAPAPPPARLTLAPLTTAAELMPEHPVRVREWPLSRTADRPLGLLQRRARSYEATLRVLTDQDPEGRDVPIDPAASTVAVDGEGALVRVLVGTVRDGEMVHTMHLSRDLVEWSTVELSAPIGRWALVAGGGLVMGDPRGTQAHGWRIDDDGTVAALAPVPVPDGATASIRSVARSAETIVAVLDMTTQGSSSPATVTSHDAGRSWGDPVPLPVTGERTGARHVRALTGGFVVTGVHRVTPSWSTEGFSRPTAWSSQDGTDFRQEEVPLPLWQRDGWTHDDIGELERGRPIDFRRIGADLPAVDADGGRLHQTMNVLDEAWVATRDADGSWHLDGGMLRARGVVQTSIADGDGRILLAAGSVQARGTDGRPLRGGSPVAPRRETTGTRGRADAAAAGVVAWKEDGLVDSGDGWYEEGRYRCLALRIAGERIEAVPDLPAEVEAWERPMLHALAPELCMVTGHSAPEDASVQARVHADGQWRAVTGLDADAVGWVGPLTTLDGRLHLAVVTGEEREGGSISWAPRIFASEDGIGWAPALEGPVRVAEEERASRGGGISCVAALGDAVVGIGAVVDEDEVNRPIVAIHDGDGWAASILPDAPTGMLDHLTRVGGEAVAWKAGDDGAVVWAVAADGSAAESYRATDRASRGPVLDLGDGVLLAGGWIDVAASEAEDGQQHGIGACIWASRDAGATWGATLLPRQAGRFPAVHLMQEGEEDVIVLLDDPDGPRGYRIPAARADVLEGGA